MQVAGGIADSGSCVVIQTHSQGFLRPSNKGAEEMDWLILSSSSIGLVLGFAVWFAFLSLVTAHYYAKAEPGEPKANEYGLVIGGAIGCGLVGAGLGWVCAMLIRWLLG